MNAEINGINLSYDVRGPQSGAPILCIHGFPLSRALWSDLARELESSQFRLILPDLRGHGESEVGESHTSMSQYAADLSALLDHIGEMRPVIVIGMSMGGYIAFEFVRRHAARVKALILVDTKEKPDTAEAAAGREQAAAKVLREGAEPFVRDLAEKLFSPRVDPALKQRWIEIMAATDQRGVASALRAMAARPDSTPTLAGITAPTLCIVGEDDKITPPEAMRSMTDGIAGARLETIAGAGHMTPVERPREFADLVKAFLGRLAG